MKKPVTFLSPRTGILWFGLAVLFLFPAAGRPQENAVPGEFQNLSKEELLNLLYYGELLWRCNLNNYASPMYHLAATNAQNLKDTNLSVRVLAQSVIYYFKTGQAAQGEDLLGSVRNSLTRVEEPEIRSLQHLAIGYGDLVNGRLKEGNTSCDLAIHEARLSGKTRLEGDCFLLRAKLDLGMNNPQGALSAARSALDRYLKAGLFLAQAEAHGMMATCFTRMNNRSSAGASAEKALKTVQDISMGPILDVNALARMGQELNDGFKASDREGQYEKALFQVLSLLVLHRNQQALGARKRIVAELKLHEGVLLAYMACFVHARGHAVPATLLLQYSGKATSWDPTLTSRVEQLWISARCLRQMMIPHLALGQLDRGDRILAQLKGPMPAVRIGLAEERGLVLLQSKNTQGAAAALNVALQRAELYRQTTDAQRLRGYLEKIRSGNFNVVEMTVRKVGPQAAKRLEQRRQMATQGNPAFFRTPFAGDYTDGSVRSSAESVQALPLPRPTPFPAKRKWTPEERIHLKQHSKAVPLILEILAQDGDSVKRLVQLGKCYYDLRKWPEATDAFERVLKLEPNNVTAKDRLPGIRARLKTP